MGFRFRCGGSSIHEVPPFLTVIAAVGTFQYGVVELPGEFDEVRREVNVVCV